MKQLMGILIAGCSCCLNAQIYKYSNAFLELGTSARALGLSGSCNASARGINAAYWNPAGISETNHSNEAALMHASYYANLANFDYLGYAHLLDSSSALGITLIRFGVDDIPNTLDLMDAQGNIDYGRISKFSISDYAFLTSYSKKIKSFRPLQLGISFKTIHRQIGSFASSWGFGMDAGLKIKLNRCTLGLMGRDISGTYNAWRYQLTDTQKQTLITTQNLLPTNPLEITSPKLVSGISFSNTLGKHLTMESEINLTHRWDRMNNSLIQSEYWNIEPAAGIELSYLQRVFLRLGTGQFQSVWNSRGTYKELDQEWSTGLGIQYHGLQLDYALCGLGSSGIGLKSHVFSFTYQWN